MSDSRFHVGCSGFHYNHWKGTFYPDDLPKTKWFDFYMQHFRTLELNVSFYRFPRLSMLQPWYEDSPADFLFASKAPRAITHFRKFLNVKSMLSDFYGVASEGLKEKLGCVLFQMPPNYTYSGERLERILENLDPGFTNVIEFRQADWWREDVYQAFAKHNITFCGMSHPSLPDTMVANSPTLYYRFHGTGQLYASNYSDADLKKFAKELTSRPRVKQAFVFFNNDIHTYAVYNAQKLMELV